MTHHSMIRSFAVAALALTTFVAGCSRGPEAPAATAHAGQRHSEDRVREVHAAERPRGDPVRGSPAAAGGGEPLVSRRPRQRGPGRTGFAHLFEHMMFQGSKHVAGRRALPTARRRRRQRHQRHDRFRSHQLLRDAAVQPARARRCGSSPIAWATCSTRSTRPSSSNQQDVVRNERRQSVENQPYGIVEEALFHQLFPKGHPVLRAASSARTPTSRPRSSTTCRDFFKQYYAPNNASLAIVGDIDKAATKALVEKYFGTAQARASRCRSRRWRRRRSPPSGATIVKDRVELPRVYMAWLTLADLSSRATPTPTSRRRVLGGGTVEPPVQEAGLREADRAGRARRSSTR